MAINDPRDISGLVFWGSADHEAANYADGATMTTWTNLADGSTVAPVSGYGGPVWYATGGWAGGPRLAFADNGMNFQLPDMTAATAGEVVIAVKPGPSTTGEGLWKFANNTNLELYGHGGRTTVYEEFGTTVRPSFTPSGVDLTAWQRYAVTSGAGDFRCFFNGAVAYTRTSNTVSFRSDPTIGVRSGSYMLTGDVGCVVLYDRQLTTTERADLDTWLAANPSGGTIAAAPTPTQLAAPLAGAAGVSAGLSVTADVRGTLPAAASLTATLSAIRGLSAGFAAAGSLSGNLTVGLKPLRATLAATTGLTAGLSVAVPPVPMSAAFVGESWLAGSLTDPPLVVETSTEYVNDGYNYDGTAAVYNEPAIAPTPAHIPRVKVLQVHQSMSAPVLVNGRPT